MSDEIEYQILTLYGSLVRLTGRWEDIEALIEELPYKISTFDEIDWDGLGKKHDVGIRVFEKGEKQRERPDIETQVAFKGDYDEENDGSE